MTRDKTMAALRNAVRSALIRREAARANWRSLTTADASWPAAYDAYQDADDEYVGALEEHFCALDAIESGNNVVQLEASLRLVKR